MALSPLKDLTTAARWALEMTGTLRISTKGILPDELARRVMKGAKALSSEGITVLQEQVASLEADLVIDVIDIGDLSHEHIKPFLLTLFPKEREVKGVTAVVRDRKDNKQFAVPYDLGECVDWFRIEK